MAYLIPWGALRLWWPFRDAWNWGKGAHVESTWITRCGLRWRQASFGGSSCRWSVLAGEGLSSGCQWWTFLVAGKMSALFLKVDLGRVTHFPLQSCCNFLDLDSSRKLQRTYTDFYTYFILVRLVSSTESQTAEETSFLASGAILNSERHSEY